jgi:hypothetical protein
MITLVAFFDLQYFYLREEWPKKNACGSCFSAKDDTAMSCIQEFRVHQLENRNRLVEVAAGIGERYARPIGYYNRCCLRSRRPNQARG